MAIKPWEIDRQAGVRYDDFVVGDPIWGFIQPTSPAGKHLLDIEGMREKLEAHNRLMSWLQAKGNLEEAQAERKKNPQAKAGTISLRAGRGGIPQMVVSEAFLDWADESEETLSAIASGTPLPKESSATSADRAMTNSARASGSGTVGSTSGGDSGDDGGGGDTRVPPGTKSPLPEYNGGGEISWHNVPKDGELWKVDGKFALAYRSDVDGPYVYYTISEDDDVSRIFPDGTPEARELTGAEADRMGAVNPGSHNLLALNLKDNWEEGFNTTIERESLTNPWLNDGEVVATMLAATLEGRTVTDADLEATEYFASRSDAEIEYVSFSATATEDELEQYHDEHRNAVRRALTEAGVRDPDPTIVDFMARRWSSGQWSESALSQQVMTVANPFSSMEMDADLAKLVESTEVDSLRGKAEETKQLVKSWLGPQHGASYSEEWYRQWAGSIMDDPNAQNDLTDYLKQQRMALYPEYQNENLKYSDIAPVWENQMRQVWGRTAQADGEWGVLDKVIRANDSAEAGKILRSEGLKQGVEKVENTAMQTMGTGFGGQVVRGS